MWTIQEATLASADRLSLQCGDMSVRWTQFVIVTDGLKAVNDDNCGWRDAMLVQMQMVTYVSLQRWPEAKKWLDDNPGNIHNSPLAFSILINVRGKKASDPRDKIYGLYGLFSELNMGFPRPDYSLDVETVYREAVVATINYDEHIRVLYYCPSDRRRETLASWVPDWAEDGWEETDSRYPVLRDRFAASAGADPIWRFSEDKRTLTLRGKILDTVVFRCEPLRSETQHIRNLAAVFRAANDNGSSIQSEYLRITHEAYLVLKSWVDVSRWSDYPTGESSKDALQRTLVNDNPDCNADSARDGTFDSWYEGMCKTFQPSPEAVAAAEAVSEIPLEQLLSFSVTSGPGQGFHSMAMAFSENKCFFYTERCYFGTAADPLPVGLEVGDQVVLISGLEMPLLVRPVGDAFKLITHVYLHGVMYGEAWDDNLVDISLV